MEKLFDKLKQTLSYLFGKEELAGLKINHSSTKSNAHEIELEEKIRGKMTKEQKEEAIHSKAESLLGKIDEISEKISFEIKHLTQQSNATWAGFIKNKLGFQSPEVQKLQQHSYAINQFTQGDKAENMENLKELLEISSAAKFMVNTLIEEANKDLKHFQEQQKEKFTAQHSPQTDIKNSAAERLAQQTHNNIGKGGRG